MIWNINSANTGVFLFCLVVFNWISSFFSFFFFAQHVDLLTFPIPISMSLVYWNHWGPRLLPGRLHCMHAKRERGREGRRAEGREGRKEAVCPWSLCLPTQVGFASFIHRQAKAHLLPPGAFHFVSHPSSTQATIRSKVTRLRGFYANHCTKKKHGYKPVPHSRKRKKMEEKNTHFKQKPFNSLTTKLRTFPLSSLRAWGHVLRGLFINMGKRKVNLFLFQSLLKWARVLVN